MSEDEKLLVECQHAIHRNDTVKVLTATDEILKRDPNNVDAMFNAGTALLLSGHEGQAVVMLNAARCATKDPAKLGAIYDNLGCCLQDYQPAEAYAMFKKALEYGEGRGTYDNLVNVCTQIGKHEEALEWADKSVEMDPAHNRSFALMQLGRWSEAWAEYAKGVGKAHRPRTDRTYDLPRWDGKKPGRVILHGEQGVGDEIMFMSMCPADFAGVIECSPRMEGLLARSWPKAKVYGTLLNNYLEWPLDERADYHLEMGGLGEIYAPQPFTRGAFLAADRPRAGAWGAWLATSSGDGGTSRLRSDHVRAHNVAHRANHESPVFRVGLAWTGGTWATGRARRSVPFDLIASKLIEQHPDVTFVNLEYEDRRDELAAYPQVLNPHWATKKGADMDDLAALVSNLDLVITPTQSIVDLAGALGVPVWVMCDEHPQWRYSLKAGEDRMWFYESARLFRQKKQDAGRWERVMNHVTTALHQMKLARAA